MTRLWLRLFLVVLAACLIGPASADETTSQPAALSPISAQAYLEHIKYLASDELGGRQTGTEGIEQAAEYIARHFVDAGLKPAGDDGTFFQQFEVQRGKKLIDTAAALKVEGIHQHWQVRKDWIPLPFTSTDDVEGPLAFAGYGIQADAYEYDDYANFDASGKILLVFRYEPRAADPEAEFGGKTLSRHALFSKKAQTAAQHEAKALLIVDPPKREESDGTLYAFDEELSEQTFDLPIVHVTREVGETLVKTGGLSDLTSLEEQLDRERKPLSADLNLHIVLKTGVRPNKFPTRNVVGLLPGRGDTSETIVLGAHYDHLGRVRPAFNRKDKRPQIHNGADDNASGTAALLELARALGQEPKLHRNLLFIAFSAEEMGLLGSAHFVAHPTVALEQLKVMVNFDMIGRFSAGKFTVYGLPTGKGLGEIVDRAATAVGLKYRAPQAGLFEASDHASFYQHDIPVLFAFTGVHKQYHTPDDDWELIDADGAAQILGMFHQVVRDLANLDEGPTFEKIAPPPEGENEEEVPVKPGIEHQKEAQETEENGATHGGDDRGAEARRPTRPKVRLGIVPDYTAGDEPGLTVSTVVDGGAAKAAGIQDGDRIIRIGEQKIKDMYGYMDALRDHKPGDTLEVVVVRKEGAESKELTLKVTLK